MTGSPCRVPKTADSHRPLVPPSTRGSLPARSLALRSSRAVDLLWTVGRFAYGDRDAMMAYARLLPELPFSFPAMRADSKMYSSHENWIVKHGRVAGTAFDAPEGFLGFHLRHSGLRCVLVDVQAHLCRWKVDTGGKPAAHDNTGGTPAVRDNVQTGQDHAGYAQSHAALRGWLSSRGGAMGGAGNCSERSLSQEYVRQRYENFPWERNEKPQRLAMKCTRKV